MTAPIELLANAEALFLDFDGPVAALMPPPANAEAATAVRDVLLGIELPPEIESTSDHLAILRWVRANCEDGVLLRVEAACTQVELQAAQACSPSVHVAALIEFAQARDLPLAIVSNNSTVAVRRFLLRWHWLDRIEAFACRTPDTIDWLKPSPRLLLLAADVLRVDISKTVFIGDNVSDVVASKAAGAPIIGLAKNEVRAVDLNEAGADAVISLHDAGALGLNRPRLP